MIRIFQKYCLTVALAWLALSFPSYAQQQEDWRQRLGVFRIGVVGGNWPLLKVRQLEPFRKVMAQALGMQVEIFPAPDHKTLIEAMIASRIEYAVFSATAFAATWRLCKCVEPLVVPLADDGTRGFYSVLIVKNGKPHTLNALKGEKILIPGRHSFAGFLYPKHALMKEGVDLATPDWPVIDKTTMRAAIEGFNAGEGRALLGWLPASLGDDRKSNRGTVFQLLEMTQTKRDDYSILWKSRLLPHGPHAVRNGLSGEAKVILSETLTRLNSIDEKAYDAIDPNFGGGFQQATLEDYAVVIEALPETVTPEDVNSPEATNKPEVVNKNAPAD